jgi:hypothetical protein
MSSWQYNGAMPWYKITEWCAANLKYAYCSNETVYFPDEREFTLFVLKWTQKLT